MKLIDSLLTKYITPRNLSIALTVLYLVSLIPMLIMARYNYPSADDYSFAATSRQAWVGQNNIIAVIGEAAQKAVTEYFEWTGCFASTFLM
ncbi:MAG: hypothetical protein LBV33_03385, partial [Lachnospiraceae bacterium]|nr:hypothetical protein [Lachnospiraceae bacterium]